jgi:hypothetical protein
MDVPSADGMLISRPVYCSPSFEFFGDYGECLIGIECHVEVYDADGELSGIGEYSPVFHAVDPAVQWARKNGTSVNLQIGSAYFWEGSGALPDRTVALDLEEAQRLYEALPKEVADVAPTYDE